MTQVFAVEVRDIATKQTVQVVEEFKTFEAAQELCSYFMWRRPEVIKAGHYYTVCVYEKQDEPLEN